MSEIRKKPPERQARVGRQPSRETLKVKDFEAVEGLKSVCFPQKAGFPGWLCRLPRLDER
jgi:hypothetical protein